MTPAGTVIPWSLTRKGSPNPTNTLELGGQIRTNAPSALRDLAIAGAGVAYLPDWLVAPDIESGALRRVLPQRS